MTLAGIERGSMTTHDVEYQEHRAVDELVSDLIEIRVRDSFISQ
jgi:hypothetical protein